MSDDIVKRLNDPLPAWREAQAAEITRLRAACDAYFKTISLLQMRHGRILVGLERRNARQRRALAKLYQRRHEKNATLATARREGMEEAARIAWDYAKRLDDMAELSRYPHVKREHEGRSWVAQTIAAAIRAAAQEGKP